MASDNVLGSSDDPLLSTGKLVVRKPSLAILPPTRMASCYQWRASPQNMKGQFARFESASKAEPAGKLQALSFSELRAVPMQEKPTFSEH